MGDVLKIADEKRAYTITDRGTYLSMKDDLDLDIIIEGDENLFNQYGIIPVNPEKNDKINAEDAKTFMEWMLSENSRINRRIWCRGIWNALVYTKCKIIHV